MRSIPLVTLLLLFYTFSASAGVSIGGSRLIYEGNKKEESISVTNMDKSPYLIQSWIEDENGTNGNSSFIITPPLFRLDGEQQNVLRIVRVDGMLRNDKETLFWLNIKSIPQSESSDNNVLQIAVRSRLKLIFRPESLKKTIPEEVTSQLQWSYSSGKLQVINPTPYYMNFMSIMVNGKKLSNINYIAPLSTASFDLPRGVSHVREVTWQIINDYGGVGALHKANI